MADEGVAGYGHEFPAHYKVMLDKLNEQRQLDQFTDITLIVDGHQFRAHKAVLAACSQFFHKFFQDFTQEPLVEIEGVSNSAFQHLMEFTYTATLSVNGSEEVNDVWRAAEYLQMQEAIKALNNRMNNNATLVTTRVLATGGAKSKAKKRKIAETSNVITESLPSVAEGETVEIEVEVGDVEEAMLEEVEHSDARARVTGSGAAQTTGSSDDSALALLADITSKYRPGGSAAAQDAGGGEQCVEAAAVGEEELILQEETVLAPKALEAIEVVEVQISQLGNSMFRCDRCDRCFKVFYHLKQHMKTHEGGLGEAGKPFMCRHCGKAYVREGTLKQHVNSCHYETEAEEQSRAQRPQKKVHVCKYCDKQFDHFGHFKEHLRKHTGEKPFECPDCHERFARNSTLKCHMAACQNGCGAKKGRKKLYECQVCNSVFNSWDQFKDHLVIHTGEKPNHCTLCDLWFTQPRDLRTHLHDLHGIQDSSVPAADGPPTGTSVTNAAGEEVILTEASAEGATSTGLILTTEDGIRVEHVTVQPMDLVSVEEAVVVEAEVVAADAAALATTATKTTGPVTEVLQVAQPPTASSPPGALASMKKEEEILEVEVGKLATEQEAVDIKVGDVRHVTVPEEHAEVQVEVEEDDMIQTVQV